MVYTSFRRERPPTLGVELELQVLDGKTLALRPWANKLLALTVPVLEGAVKPEFHACCVEVNTAICRNVDEVERDLTGKLDVLEQAAESLGLALGWSGTHPFSRWEDQPITSTARYRGLAERFGDVLRRQVTFGLHVHVGVGDGDSVLQSCAHIERYLPAILALSANSPFWCERVSGLQSYRSEILAASHFGLLPPHAKSWAEYSWLMKWLIETGSIESLQELWWDVRPNAELGTIEVRICDMPSDLRSVLGITAMIQGLIHESSFAREIETTNPAIDPLKYRINRWQASRFGLDATFVDPSREDGTCARNLLRDLIDRLMPVAEILDSTRHLEFAQAMVESPAGAERQIATYEATRDLTEVIRRNCLGSRSLSSEKAHRVAAMGATHAMAVLLCE